MKQAIVIEPADIKKYWLKSTTSRNRTSLNRNILIQSFLRFRPVKRRKKDEIRR